MWQILLQRFSRHHPVVLALVSGGCLGTALLFAHSTWLDWSRGFVVASSKSGPAFRVLRDADPLRFQNYVLFYVLVVGFVAALGLVFGAVALSRRGELGLGGTHAHEGPTDGSP